MIKKEYMVPLASLLEERRKHKLTKQKLQSLQITPNFFSDEPIENIVEYIRELTINLKL